MITVLPEPLAAVRLQDGSRVLILAWIGGHATGPSTEAICATEEGDLIELPVASLKAEVRFSYTDHRWHDVALEEEALYDIEADPGPGGVSGPEPDDADADR